MNAASDNMQSSTVTVVAPASANVARTVVSFDKLTATTGTVAITIKARGMADAHAPANNSFDVTASQRQFELVGGDVGSVILTPSSLDAAVKYRVAFYD